MPFVPSDVKCQFRQVNSPRSVHGWCSIKYTCSILHCIETVEFAVHTFCFLCHSVSSHMLSFSWLFRAHSCKFGDFLSQWVDKIRSTSESSAVVARLQREVERMESALPLLKYVGGEILSMDLPISWWALQELLIELEAHVQLTGRPQECVCVCVCVHVCVRMSGGCEGRA